MTRREFYTNLSPTSNDPTIVGCYLSLYQPCMINIGYKRNERKKRGAGHSQTCVQSMFVMEYGHFFLPRPYTGRLGYAIRCKIQNRWDVQRRISSIFLRPVMHFGVRSTSEKDQPRTPCEGRTPSSEPPGFTTAREQREYHNILSVITMSEQW